MASKPKFVIQFSDQVREDIQKLIRAGIPGLKNKVDRFRKLLANDPKYPGLGTHKLQNQEFDGKDVWISYLQNNTSNALRARWIYLEGNIIEVIEILTHNRY